MPGQCGDVAAGLENIPVEILYVLAEKVIISTLLFPILYKPTIKFIYRLRTKRTFFIFG
tara:strand:+ start:139 stop:315 length:177 start_codon:yes stop_codon:yes gene_type:complete